jgi:hypothetical protein
MQQHEDGAAGRGGAHEERLLTLRRSDGCELRIEWQCPDDGPPIVSLRVWIGPEPLKRKGFSLRAAEVAPVIGALVASLDRFRLRRVARDRAFTARETPPGRRGNHEPPTRAA